MNGMFSGVRVIELAQFVYIPGAGALMADQGAEVIHVEMTGTGDPYRSLRVGDGREVGSVNLAMEQNNRGKKSIALDLKNPSGREAFLALIKTADVFVTSLRPGAIARLDLEPDDLWAVNPKLIYARGNGLGFQGDEANKPGFDASAFWARGGLADVMSPPGQPITPPRPAFGDHSGSMAVAYGIAAALFNRERTGEGALVENSLLSTALWMLSGDITYAQTEGYKIHREGSNRMPLMSAYETSDGVKIQLMLLNPQPHWPGFCKMIDADELADDTRFADNDARMANGDELVAIIAERIGKHDWSEWQPLFDAWEAPWELIQTVKDLYDDPQVKANQMIRRLSVRGSEIAQVSGPVTFNGDAFAGPLKAAPQLGEHTDELLASAGLSQADIQRPKAMRSGSVSQLGLSRAKVAAGQFWNGNTVSMARSAGLAARRDSPIARAAETA